MSAKNLAEQLIREADSLCRLRRATGMHDALATVANRRETQLRSLITECTDAQTRRLMRVQLEQIGPALRLAGDIIDTPAITDYRGMVRTFTAVGRRLREVERAR